MADLLFLYLVGSRIRGVHQEGIMSYVYDYNKCANKMKINNFLWKAFLGAGRIYNTMFNCLLIYPSLSYYTENFRARLYSVHNRRITNT